MPGQRYDQNHGDNNGTSCDDSDQSLPAPPAFCGLPVLLTTACHISTTIDHATDGVSTSLGAY
jgi:hypothetical protein